MQRIFTIAWLILAVHFLNGCASFLDFFKSDETLHQNQTSAFPPRPSRAMSGSEFLRTTSSLSPEERDRAILRELLTGNVPSHLRQSVPVRLSQRIGGKPLQATVYVLPDYLAIGSDQDFVRMPMTPMTAQRIADKFGFVLPTRHLVDEIYRQAAIKLPPSPMPAGPNMISNDYYRRHQQTIEGQLHGRKRSLLLAGHKKDIVVTNRLLQLPTRVAIYGWHRLNGVAIQPLSLVHGRQYADYSHGVRFVQSVMQVGTYKMFVTDVLKNTKYAPLLSDEGAIRNPHLSVD